MEKIKTIIEKEWAEVFKNRMVLFTVAFLPLILTALPLITLAATSNVEGAMSTTDSPPDAFFGELCADLSEMDCTQVYMLNIYTLMFMMLPVVIPAAIASYSIVGEKTSRSLEPLLATPITTAELLIGKAVAAAVPAVLATWGAFGIYVVGARLMVSNLIFGYLIAPEWLLAIFVVSPLLTLMAVSTAIMVSSRVTDPRVAEQLSAVVVLPLLLLIIGQSVGFILIDQRVIVIMGIVVAVIDAALFYFSVQVFQRETILTRWK
jgi:ABC-2 type transport system permease protein